MSVTVFTAEGCGACDAARMKLALLGVDYEELDVDETLYAEDGGDVLAALRANSHAVPLFRIDGDFMGYPAAMRRLKAGLEG